MGNVRKRNNVGKCVICRQEVTTLTREHLLPKSWYPPDQVQPTTIRQTFPSCAKCNEELGKIECRLFEQMALTLDFDSGIYASLAKKALDSLSVTNARDDKSAEIRFHKKRRLLEENILEHSPHESPPVEIFASQVVRPEELDKDRFYSIKIDSDDLHAFLFKIVRGVVFIEYGLFIKDDGISVILREKPKWAEQVETSIVDIMGLQVMFGPFLNESSVGLSFSIYLWKRFIFDLLVWPDNDENWVSTLTYKTPHTPTWTISSGVYPV